MTQNRSVKDAIKQSSVLFNQGRYQQAESLCRSVLAVHPNNADAHHILGVIALRCNNYGAAIKFIKKAIKSNKKNAEYYDSLGNAYKSTNDTANAIKNFRKALSLDSRIAKTHYNLANVYHQKNNVIEAEKYFKTAIKLNPEHSQSINNLAILYRQQGDYKTAEQLLLRIVNLSPTNVMALNNLAINYDKAGEYKKSLDTYRKAISIKPDYFEAYYNIGNLYRLLNDSSNAIKSYQESLRLKPDLVEAKNNMAIVYMENKDYSKAIVHFSEAARINPRYTFTFLNFANLYKKIGETDKAESLYKEALEIEPNFMEAYYNLACLYSDTAHSELAISHFEKVISINPQHAAAFKNMGNVYKDMGRFDLAINAFKKSISINPEFTEAYRELTSVKKLDKDDAEFTFMRKMLSDKRITDEQRMHLAFGLARVYEELKEYDDAFKYLAQANQCRRKLIPYNPGTIQTIFSNTKKLFCTEFIEKYQPFGSPDKTPIFIVGMPRSGSSLIEQILATHSKVYGAGELNYIELSINKICSVPTQLDYPDCLNNIDQHTVHSLAQSYLKRIRELSSADEYITDKMPQNFIYIGLIKILFPNAKFIHSTRDGMDTCLSIYKHGFYDGHAYADDLQDLGGYYNLYRDLMNHWNKILPACIFEVNYENLVENQEYESRRLLDFCDLPWEQECLSFYKTRRRVHTASSTQVRKGIYKDSVQLWKHYEPHLHTLKHVLNYHEK